MRLYFAPLLWLTAAALGLGLNAFWASSRFRQGLTPDRLAGIHKAYNNPFFTVESVAAGLYCTLAAAVTLLSGGDTWWLWFLAAPAQFAIAPVRRFAGVKLGAVQIRRDLETKRRQRRVLSFALPAAACLSAAQPVAEPAVRLHNNIFLAVTVVLELAALGGFTAAGWAAVWASEPTLPPPQD